MATEYNHNGKFGTNATGKDRFRHVRNPDKMMNAIDLADFQFNKGKVGLSDIDACINLGGKKGQINILMEFKENSITNGCPKAQRVNAIPMGQRIMLENMARGIQYTTAFHNEVTPDFRVPGTLSVVLLVSHPDAFYPTGSEAIVESVFWADEDRWVLPVSEDTPDITLAQYLDLLSAMLNKETPEARAVNLFRGIGTSGLAESGQDSLVNSRKA